MLLLPITLLKKLKKKGVTTNRDDVLLHYVLLRPSSETYTIIEPWRRTDSSNWYSGETVDWGSKTVDLDPQTLVKVGTPYTDVTNVLPARWVWRVCSDSDDYLNKMNVRDMNTLIIFREVTPPPSPKILTVSSFVKEIDKLTLQLKYFVLSTLGKWMSKK